MKAAFIKAPGPAENIIYDQFPDPKVGATECLITVSAVAVNPIDTYIRSGGVKMDIPLPFIIGSDLAGRVTAVGRNVQRFHVGDRVWGSNQGMMGRQGTFAEQVAVDERWLHRLPAGVPDEQAAALALVGITAHLGLRNEARLQEGEILFVNGGTGGVGSAVVQMAKALGARVITTAGTPEKVALCRKFGADLAINYKTEDVPGAVKQFAPAGVNVWWETLREPDLDRAVTLLAPRGRMILMAGREARPPFPVGPFYVKGCSLYGFAMFNSAPEDQRVAADEINRWLEQGKLRANIDRILSLSQAAEAHRLQEQATLSKSGALAGKLVLKPDPA